jgi:26S proteasome regulatory subunit N8
MCVLPLSAQGKVTQRTFQHVACTVGANEPEEIGVEHLLRDVNDPSVSELAGEVRHKLLGLKGLATRLQEMAKYLSRVLEGTLPVNHDIMYKVQSILNLLPNLGVEKLVHAFASVGNDLHLAMYLSNLVRSITSLHDLVVNKLQYKDSEEDKLADLSGTKVAKGDAAAAGKSASDSKQESKGK